MEPTVTRRPRCTVIIPCHNEAGSIGVVLAELAARAPQLGLEVIVVDDGSGDGSGALAARYEATVIRHQARRGYGASIKTGVLAARADLLATMDADGQHRAADLERLLGPARPDALVLGVRTRTTRQRPPLSRMLVRILASAVVGRGVPDANTGLRVLPRRFVLDHLAELPDGFSLSTTLTYLWVSSGGRVRCVPIQDRARLAGATRTRLWRDCWRSTVHLARLVWRHERPRLRRLAAREAQARTVGSPR
jgi:glycosyltransferase involved in cell wall biosynthesis